MASDCGRLGRQAAGHPWSAPRGEKLPKRLPDGLGAKTDRQVETRPMSAGTQADRAAS